MCRGEPFSTLDKPKILWFALKQKLKSDDKSDVKGEKLMMKMELRIDGKLIVIEAENIISVQIIEEKEMGEPLPIHEKEENADTALYARLVDLRRELATAANVPPYVVFKDLTLREMADKLPKDLTELGTIKGVGKAKLEKYGADFLAVINEGSAV